MLDEKTLKNAIDVFGADHQKRQMLEEMSELAIAILKENRYRGRAESMKWTRNAQEEVADVIIMAHQMRLMLGAEQVDNWIEYKMERLERRIEREVGELI